MADFKVTSFYNNNYSGSKMFDNNLYTHWGSREGKYWDRNPVATITFYSIKEINRVKIVRLNERQLADHNHRYANLCVVLLDDTNNELDKKCTGPNGIFGEPYLVPKTNSIVMNFNDVQNVKTVKVDFTKPTENRGCIAELFIYGMH